MKITKYSHSCLLVETKGVRILTDPGIWNTLPETDHLEAILVTHEHGDHCDIEQIGKLVEAHPGVRVITNDAVAGKLKEAGVASEILIEGAATEVNGVSIESFGSEHAAIYGGVSPCKNTGYLVGDEIFIPGDALHDLPGKPIRILALPTGGPWMKLSEAIDYVKEMKPEIVFPIHDAMYTEEVQRGMVPRLVGGMLESFGIKFVDMPDNSTQEF